MKAQGGFTRDLYHLACKKPGLSFRAAIEGPYGHIPDAKTHDKATVFAGGSGATFAFAIALYWIRSHKSKSPLEVVWVGETKVGRFAGHSQKEQARLTIPASLSWFRAELAKLRSHSRVSVKLYVSGGDIKQSDESPSDESGTSLAADAEKSELGGMKVPQHPPHHPAETGRPTVGAIIARSLLDHSKSDVIFVACKSSPSLLVAKDSRLIFAGCGPEALVRSVRNAVAKSTTSSSPNLTLHCEEFSY